MHTNNYRWHHQAGSSLILTLITLMALLFSVLALVRSSTSSTALVGNIQFKQGVSLAADLGIYNAINSLRNIASKEVTIAGLYYPVQQPMDANGLPVINWTTVAPLVQQDYTLQYIIERLCAGALPVVSTDQQCSTGNSSQGASSKAGSIPLANSNMYYKVTINVNGPNNSQAYVQAILKQQ